MRRGTGGTIHGIHQLIVQLGVQRFDGFELPPPHDLHPLQRKAERFRVRVQGVGLLRALDLVGAGRAREVPRDGERPRDHSSGQLLPVRVEKVD